MNNKIEYKFLVCVLMGALVASLPGCYESHTLAMEPADEPVLVRVECDAATETTAIGGSELEAVTCHITPNHDVDVTGTSMHVAAVHGTSYLVRGSGGTRYFTRFREFVRDRSGEMLGPFEDSDEVEPGSPATSLINGPGSFRVRARETVDLVFAFTIAPLEDAPGELFSDGSVPTHVATWFDWNGHTLGPNAFRLVVSGRATRRLRDGEVSGDITGPRMRQFSVVAP